MWKIAKLSFLFLFIIANSASYLEFELYRSPQTNEKHSLQPISCKNEANINQDAEYKEICYEKDIAYIMSFRREGRHIAMAADFTTPLSWMKSENCVIDGTSEKCKLTIETIGEKVKDIKRKVGKKFHKDTTPQKQNAIIEGSSETIRGQLQLSKSVSFLTKDSNRLTNFFQILMLGFFFAGETDNLVLESTNFISATAISENLNKISDGAISLRLDQSSQRSFLDQIFTYVKSAQKMVTIYIGNDNRTLTIGDLTSKYTLNGFSSINWVSTQDDQGYGKLVEVTNVGIEDSSDDSDKELDDSLPAIFTLSSSYIGLPEELITKIITESFSKLATCKIDKTTFYTECSSTNKKNIEKIINKHLYFTLSGSNLMIPIKDLIITNDHGKRIVLNIKKTFNNRAIFGEPVFKKYAMFFDYSKDKIGYALKREDITEFFNIVVLIRVICFIFLIGFSLLVCFKPCRKFLQTVRNKNFFSKENDQEGRTLRYAPIQENPYEQLKGKIQDVISSTDKQFDQS